jgi:hypothetical protein
MKSRLNRKNVKLRKDEAGYALMWVLVVLILAGIILVPLFLLMTAGLTSSHNHEQRMLRFYAADAGIEDAIWKMQNPPLPASYDLVVSEDGREMDVKVTAPSSDESMRMFFGAILDWGKGKGNYNKKAPAGGACAGDDCWMVVYGLSGDNTYTIQITYNGKSENKPIDGIGAWFYGGNFSLKPGSAHGITDDYPKYEFQPPKYYAGGTAFIWEWKDVKDKPAKPPKFSPGETMTQTFEFTPPGNPEPNVGWVDAGSDNIFITWSGAVYLGSIKAVASRDLTDPSEKTTTVTSYVFAGDTGEVIVLAYSYE